MVRLYLILAFVALVVEVFAIVDAALSDRRSVRGIPKAWWVIVILFIPVVGWLLWFLIGRPRRKEGSKARGAGRQVAPDDDPEFLRQLRRDLDDGTSGSGPDRGDG